MDIAITGMDCRFPAAPDLHAFWKLLVSAEDAVGPVPADRWDRDAFFSEHLAPGRMNTRDAGCIAAADAFDRAVFGITPAEAAAMDPQQRLLLQCAWRALEDAGLDPARLAGSRTGVFLGIMGNEWAQAQFADFAAITPHAGSGNGYGMTANRVSYHLGLTGPSLAVDTACSSSLVAVHLACQALRAGECDVAIAAGVNLILTPALGIFYTHAGLSAPDGRCRPFGADASGIGRAEGVGAVVLRRAQDALAAGERRYALVRGSAVNHDGRSNGMTAPSRRAQVDVIRLAHARAGVDPEDIAFIEAHGTGTVLGDMIEVKALGEIHAHTRERPCLLGSVKGNIGHAEGAAGIAGLIKAALALHHGLVPPSRCVGGESPRLELARHGLALTAEANPLPGGRVHAGVSSFGLGGTNAHAVLASVEPRRAPAEAPDSGLPAVFVLSASDVAAVQRNAAASARAVRAAPEVPLTAWCRASTRVKASLPHRFAIAVRTGDELARTLEAVSGDASLAERMSGRRKRRLSVAFAFTGQGAQRPRMLVTMAAASPRYRAHLADADDAIAPHLGTSIAGVIAAGTPEIDQTGFAQPAIFAVQYALARTLGELGVRPAAVVGHSIGEFAAACTAGILSLEDAARMVTVRGALMQALPTGGAMLSVRASADDVGPLLAGRPSLAIAAYNEPRGVVVSGDAVELEQVGAKLTARGLESQPLMVSHAFHSPRMEPMLAPFRRAIAGARPAAGRCAFISTVTAGLVAGETLDAEYWTAHVAAPVRFAEALGAVVSAGATHLVEIGPRPVLSRLARRVPAAGGLACLSAVGAEQSPVDLATLLAALYVAGVDPHWEPLHGDGRAAHLPSYEFDASERFWKPLPAASAPEPPRPAPPASASGHATFNGHAPAARRAAPSSGARGAAFDAVVEAVCTVSGHEAGVVSPDSRLREDLGLDSLMLVSLKHKLDARFSALADMDVASLLPHISTVESLASFLAVANATPCRAP